MNRLDLRKQFMKETGKGCEIPDFEGEPVIFTKTYVEWLEDKVNNLNKAAVIKSDGNERRHQLIAYQKWCYEHPEYAYVCESSKVDIYLKAINCC